MEVLKKIILYITTPFNRFGSRGITDSITKSFNKNSYLNYVVAFIITAAIVLLAIFIF